MSSFVQLNLSYFSMDESGILNDAPARMMRLKLMMPVLLILILEILEKRKLTTKMMLMMRP